MNLIAYDITDKKRLRKLSKLLESYGLRVQYSMFEADITKKELEILISQILDIIDEESDKVYIYTIDNTKAQKEGKKKSIWEMIF